MNNNWLRNTIRSFEPYVVPEIKEHTVINANESPYNIFDFPKVKADFLERLAKTPSYHYPDPFAEELRAALAKYVGCQPQEVLVSNGGDEIISLIMNTFLNPGDTLLTHTPTFDIYGIDAEVLGAQVVTVSDLDGYRRDRDGLLTKVKEVQPKVTVLCNPNNPTGSVIPNWMLEKIVEIAKKNNVWILSDEVYRGLNMVGSPYSKSIADLYNKGISVGSMSKAYSLAGLRVGWVCAREDLIAEINKHRQYNTISISILDDYFSALALENHVCILNRNLKIMKTGMEILNNWLNDEIYVKTNLPQGGTTALLRYKKDIPSRILCKELYQKSNVAILPAETMEMEGFVRVGFCVQPEILEHGLKEFSKILRKV